MAPITRRKRTNKWLTDSRHNGALIENELKSKLIILRLRKHQTGEYGNSLFCSRSDRGSSVSSTSSAPDSFERQPDGLRKCDQLSEVEDVDPLITSFERFYWSVVDSSVPEVEVPFQVFSKGSWFHLRV